MPKMRREIPEITLRYQIKNKGVIELTEINVSESQTKDSFLNELAGSKTGKITPVKGKYGKYGGQYVP